MASCKNIPPSSASGHRLTILVVVPWPSHTLDGNPNITIYIIPLSLPFQRSFVWTLAMYMHVAIIIVNFLAWDSLSLADCYLWRGRVYRDGYRDQIVTRLHSVMQVCLCIPRRIHCSCGTLMALLCILVSKLVSFAFCTIPIICPFRIFHL